MARWACVAPGSAVVYSTANPFLFSGRVLLQTGEGSYRIVDGSMTNCRLPHPDWELIARAIKVDKDEASTANAFFKLFGVPIFYLPYLRHPVDETGRQSGLLIPVVSNGSSIRGYTFGEQVYIVLNRSMDIVVGAEYYSKRGYAPNGDFRYKGSRARSPDRALECAARSRHCRNAACDGTGKPRRRGYHRAGPERLLPRHAHHRQCRVSVKLRIPAGVQRQLLAGCELAGAEHAALTHDFSGYIASGSVSRLQTFASSTPGDEARILHLPSLRFDALDRPLGGSPFYWGGAASLGHLGRAETNFHARNIGRIDVYPHLSLPIVAGGWSVVPEVALRETFYSGSQTPDLTGVNGGTPFVATIRSIAVTLKRLSMCARPRWSAISRWADGTGSCGM